VPLVSYKEVLPLGLVRKVESILTPTNTALIQQFVNMVRKSDTRETYKKRTLAELEKYMIIKSYLSDAEYQLLFEIINWIAQNIDSVKAKKKLLSKLTELGRK